MAKLKSVWLQELTWEDVAEYLKSDDIILFPVGSTEQHGPAGPLGVDSYAAIALAEDAAKETGVLVTPPLWFGDSPHHLDFPGTISLRTETLVEVAKDVICSLARHGFKKIIIINGHKGTNNAGLITACRSLHQYELPDVFLSLVDPMYLARGIAHIKDAVEHHAGELEISHVWYKHPHLIKQEKLTGEQVNLEPLMSEFTHKDLLGKGGDSIEIFWNSREQKAFAPTGSFSDSSHASPEKGRQYHEYMVKNLVKFIGWLRRYEGPIGRIKQ
ncbi:creatininase family protein [Zhaonella formicivorans]|uniref:creatininase family protein n=1 Tax=Zhaonella formicivorans TaxID=2528593 RepID=UPI0010E60D76|nr:creatininase family protein [Zhaonella formicivorans]